MSGLRQRGYGRVQWCGCIRRARREANLGQAVAWPRTTFGNSVAQSLDDSGSQRLLPALRNFLLLNAPGFHFPPSVFNFQFFSMFLPVVGALTWASSVRSKYDILLDPFTRNPRSRCCGCPGTRGCLLPSSLSRGNPAKFAIPAEHCGNDMRAEPFPECDDLARSQVEGTCAPADGI